MEIFFRSSPGDSNLRTMKYRERENGGVFPLRGGSPGIEVDDESSLGCKETCLIRIGNQQDRQGGPILAARAGEAD